MSRKFSQMSGKPVHLAVIVKVRQVINVALLVTTRSKYPYFLKESRYLPRRLSRYFDWNGGGSLKQKTNRPP